MLRLTPWHSNKCTMLRQKKIKPVLIKKERRGETEPSFLKKTVSHLHIYTWGVMLPFTLSSLINLILPGKCSGEEEEKRQKHSEIFQGSIISWEWPSFRKLSSNISNFFKLLTNSRLY